MVLKEAYRYQNYLDKLIREGEIYLAKKNFITKTTENHHRSKVNSEAQDEIIEIKEIDVDFTPAQAVDFLVKVIDEKQKLSVAIVAAKKTTEIDIDSSVAMNKVKQGYISILKTMVNTKSNESQATGTDFVFNVNNEQVSVRYPIDKVTTINFDRNNIKGLIRKYKNECDKISSQKDLIDLTTIVEYNPVFEIDIPFEDLVM